MQLRHATATFVGPGAMDDPFAVVISREALEAASADERGELWFDLGPEDSDEVSRLSIDLAYADIEEMLRLAPEDEILLELDCDVVEGLFGESDVEAHGLKGAIAIAVSGAALLAPAAAQAASPLTYDTSAKVQKANVASTVQVRPAATVQAARVQVAKPQVARTFVLKASGFDLVRSVR
jgi:hypothetical protein